MTTLEDELGVSDLMDQALAEADKAFRQRVRNEISQMPEWQLYKRLRALLMLPQTGPIDMLNFCLSPEEVEIEVICHELLVRHEQALSNCRCQGGS